jgi:hypothetical protein
VGVGDAVGEGVTLGVDEVVGEGVTLGVAEAVGEGVTLGVAEAVGEAVGVGEVVALNVAEGVGAGAGAEPALTAPIVAVCVVVVTPLRAPVTLTLRCLPTSPATGV